MNDNATTPPAFDSNTPTPARVYDYYLGGKDNFQVDREAGKKVLEVFPQASTLAQRNRGFLLQAVRYCAEAGIDQFIDLGTGIPASLNVTEIACKFNQDARVVGVDNDPVVLSHQRLEVSAKRGRYTVIEGDIRRPWAILADPCLSEVIDLSRPVAVLCVAVLHFISDEEDPAGILSAFTDAMAAGSFLAVSAATSTNTDLAVIAPIEDAYRSASTPVIFRPADQICSWFEGLDLVYPGVVDVTHWPTCIGVPTRVRILGGLARKPGGPDSGGS
ncbi:SAM-dependent methyltransferase [Actinomadura sp. DC4]|uniref:SAM-dependent methyltransferase n=1 Tax=Actinomadura sp. DC4 TaxID=3055069 RepID=UPI0025AF3CE4|nr:SAM-dependent methyltransferase [Actinomadura sp. DC4]MDN3351803.1 SAM-dependent methyltransferase [Actinomadura sp. DC4]